MNSKKSKAIKLEPNVPDRQELREVDASVYLASDDTLLDVLVARHLFDGQDNLTIERSVIENAGFAEKIFEGMSLSEAALSHCDL